MLNRAAAFWYFRADAGFANPEVYEFLEAQRIKYAIRLPKNPILQGRIGYLLKRPVGRPITMPISPIKREAGPSRAGLPELAVAVRTSLLFCRKAEIGEYSRQIGSHLENPAPWVGKKLFFVVHSQHQPVRLDVMIFGEIRGIGAHEKDTS
jgi:hypothetical protein